MNRPEYVSEHVGIRRFSSFLTRMHNLLDDDGVFFLQYSGLRKSWQYEDLIWGLFMNKYIFPGADASVPLSWIIDKAEAAGFDVKQIDTVGVHYSATGLATVRRLWSSMVTDGTA